MTRKPLTLLFTKLLFALLGFLVLFPAQAQQLLQVGRTDLESPISEIVERVVNEALRRRGLSAQYQLMPLPRSIALANDGALDADLLRIADVAKQFPNLVMVPTSVAVVYVALYSRDPKLLTLPRAEIAKLRIGLPRGIIILVKNSVGMNVSDSQTVFKAFDMLRNDRFDIAMLPHIDAELEMAKHAITGIARRPSYWAAEPVYFYLNKKHQALVPVIDSALQEMQKEGLINKYYEEGLQKINVKLLKPVS
jgi:polar amino acid transport system substrate-binding protein